MARWLMYNAIRVIAVWGLWWLIGSASIQFGLPKLLNLSAKQGAYSQATLNSVRGFPGHFALDLSDLHVSDSNRSTVWKGEKLVLKMRAWNPAHFNVIFPQDHSFQTGGQVFKITAGENETEFALAARPSLPFKGASGDYKGLEVRTNSGGTFQAEDAVFDVWRSREADNGYDINAKIQNLMLPLHLRRQIDLSLSQSETISLLSIDGMIDFDAPWDRHSMNGLSPQPTQIYLKKFAFVWDDLTLSADGNLDINDKGQPRGKITVQTQDWRSLLDFVSVSANMSQEDKEKAQSALEFISGGEDSLKAPIGFQDGILSVGPIPIGKVPIIRF